MASPLSLEAVRGDVVAVRLPPGPAWRGIVERVWHAGAVLFPIDHRLPAAAADHLIKRGPASVVVDASGSRRVGEAAPPVPQAPDMALLIATSGSSGRARLVELTRASVIAAVTASASALGAGAEDGWVSALPLGHIGGLLVVMRTVLLGAPLNFAPAGDAAALAPPPGAAFISLVATQVERALDAGVSLSGYRAIVVGGAPMPARLAERARDAGARCVVTYGLTQSCGGVVYDGVPLDGVGLRIVDGGEVQLAGPTLMRGYRDEPPGDDFTADGWLRTRDAGGIDETGLLRVLGRLDEAIITGGEKVWPAAVEAVLARDPALAEAAVIGLPDTTWGERVVVVAVPADAGTPPTLSAIRDRVGRQLGRHHAPRELLIAERLPRTPLGKVARADVRALADQLRGCANG